MDDLISRQAAIAEFSCCELTPDGGIDANYAIEFLEQLPSAQTEIIRCQDCKYWHREIYNGIEYFAFSSCDLNHYGDGRDFYCADAERRTDG